MTTQLIRSNNLDLWYETFGKKEHPPIGFVRQGIYSPLFGRNYPTFTATHLPKEFHLLMMLAMMVPSCFCESIF